MKRYERITYREEGHRRSQTGVYEVLAELPGALLLRPVDDEGNDRSFIRADGVVVDRQQLISTSLIRRRTPLQWNLHYGELEAVPDTKEAGDA